MITTIVPNVEGGGGFAGRIIFAQTIPDISRHGMHMTNVSNKMISDFFILIKLDHWNSVDAIRLSPNKIKTGQK
jgi:hypothetical protein